MLKRQLTGFQKDFTKHAKATKDFRLRILDGFGRRGFLDVLGVGFRTGRPVAGCWRPFQVSQGSTLSLEPLSLNP